jgi:DNA-binding NarL/FixJ family response regulator
MNGSSDQRSFAHVPSQHLEFDNVLNSDGRLLHVARDEQTINDAARLRSAVIAIERSRREASTDPAQALAYWKAMVMGRWTLIERFESDGRRILIARPNAPDIHAHRALSERERKVVSLAALGHPSKLIAYELGFSFSMVSRVLARALEKLGIRSRLELVEVHGAIVGTRKTSFGDAGDY